MSFRKQIQRGNFGLVLQPIVNVAEKRIICFEVLARFDPESYGLPDSLSTQKMVSLIEEKELSTVFDNMVIDQSFELLKELDSKLNEQASLSLNVCAQSMSEPSFEATLLAKATNAGITPSRITLEITESTMLTQVAHTAVIPALYKHGFHIAVDDFISGYSNFSVLTNPYIESIKVDRSVTLEIENSDIARRFMRGLQMLVDSLGKRLIIEGVETYSQFLFLDAVGFDQFQGDYFAPPMPASELPLFYRAFKKRDDYRIFEAVKNDQICSRIAERLNHKPGSS